MSDPLGVTPDQLRTTAQNLADVSKQMDDVSTDLQGKVTGLGTAKNGGAIWGTDTGGRNFEYGDGSSDNPGYDAQSGDVYKAIGEKVKLLQNYAQSLQTAADTLQGQDSGN
jgi:hypothetical protein